MFILMFVVFMPKGDGGYMIFTGQPPNLKPCKLVIGYADVSVI